MDRSSMPMGKLKKGTSWHVFSEANTMGPLGSGGSHQHRPHSRLQGRAAAGGVRKGNRGGQHGPTNNRKGAADPQSGSLGPAQVPSTGWRSGRADSHGDTARQSADAGEN